MSYWYWGMKKTGPGKQLGGTMKMVGHTALHWSCDYWHSQHCILQNLSSVMANLNAAAAAAAPPLLLLPFLKLIIIILLLTLCRAGQLSQYSDWLWAGQSRDQIPVVGARFLATCTDQSWGPPSLLYNGNQVFPRGKAAGAWCWPSTPF
jgi:hypothetical protein